MVPAPGVECANPIEHAERLACLDWYDGEILVLDRVNDALYMRVWTDSDDTTHRWLVVRVTQQRLDAFGDGAITLADVFRRPEDGYVFVLDAHDETTYRCTLARVTEVAVCNFPGNVAFPRSEWHEQPADGSLNTSAQEA